MTPTQCNPERFEFQALGRRRVVAAFDGGRMTSDAGGLLLREVERATGLVGKFAACFEDGREPGRVEHALGDLVAQRLFALALGYEDLNDHEELRGDPLLALLVGKLAPTRRKGAPLAGKSTLNRLERSPEETTRYHKIRYRAEAMDRLWVEHFLDSHREPPGRIILDLDATDDPLHGEQEERFFHGYHRCYCYLPLYIFSEGFLLCARLRPSNIDESQGTAEELARILIRADSAFARERLMHWCEENAVDYVLGLARNARLVGEIEEALEEAGRLHASTELAAGRESGRPARLFQELRYRTRESWSRERRVVAKAEHLAKGPNPRFIVTSLASEEFDAKTLYERLYGSAELAEACARGEMENRIKEQQLDLFSGRTSAATMRANQLRLSFSSVAYLLLHALRRLALGGTHLARATCGTLRLKLLKIGAQVRVSFRRLKVAMASGYPYAPEFAAAWRALRSHPPP